MKFSIARTTVAWYLEKMGKRDLKKSALQRLVRLVMIMSLVLFPNMMFSSHGTSSNSPSTVMKMEASTQDLFSSHCVSEIGKSVSDHLEKHKNDQGTSGSECCSLMGCSFAVSTVAEDLPPRMALSERFEISNETGVFQTFHGLNRPPSA